MISTPSLFDKVSPKLLMFCGKGGVGKTTMATTTAFHFAKNGKKTLLISSDPSPSISDILEIDVLGKIVPIEAVRNLYAAELDYDTIIELWKGKFGEKVYEILSTFLPVEREIIDYVAKAPGIDYEFALSYIYDIYKSSEFNTIVWDMAPAGGTLSLISLQEKFYKHLGDATKLYIKIKHSLNTLKGKKYHDPLKLISEWEDLSRNVLDMLKDTNSKAVIVTIPESLGVKQTFRIVDDFNSYSIDVLSIIINYILKPEINSDLLTKRKNMQEKYIKEITDFYGEKMHIMHIPLLPYEIKGIDNILKMENEIFTTKTIVNNLSDP